MIFDRPEKFNKQYKKLPINIQTKFDKKLRLLAVNWRHPSIHAKKKQGEKDVWEGRVDRFYRFTFTISGDVVILRTVGPHDEALSN